MISCAFWRWKIERSVCRLDLDEVEKSRCRFFIVDFFCVLNFVAATAIAVLRTTTMERSLTGGELMCVLVATATSEYSFFRCFFSFGGIWCCGRSGYILEKFSRETRVCRRWWRGGSARTRIYCYFLFLLFVRLVGSNLNIKVNRHCRKHFPMVIRSFRLVEYIHISFLGRNTISKQRNRNHTRFTWRRRKLWRWRRSLKFDMTQTMLA